MLLIELVVEQFLPDALEILPMALHPSRPHSLVGFGPSSSSTSRLQPVQQGTTGDDTYILPIELGRSY